MTTIGLFDSGIGGLSIWRTVTQYMPQVNTVYVADQAYCPYGPRPPAEIIERSTRLTEFLLKQSCDLIVVACNTASASALPYLRERFSTPIVGLEPAIKPAALNSRTGQIGVLATEGTFAGTLYQQTVHRYAQHVQIHTQVGYGLVELVEAGQIHTPQTVKILQQLLAPFLRHPIDHLVLGCTHYPFLGHGIQRIVGPQIRLIDSAEGVARQVARLIPPSPRWRNRQKPEHRFYTSVIGKTDFQPMVFPLQHLV